MSNPMDSLKSQLASLPIRERVELAHYLLGTLEPEIPEDVAAAWGVEVDRRVADIEAGRVVGKPADQVFAELRERFA